VAIGTKRFGRRSLILLAGLVLAMGIGGISRLGQQRARKFSGPVRSITVGTGQEYSSLIWVARQNGYFTENGLDVTTKEFFSNRERVDALLSGRVDITTASEFAFVRTSFDHPDLRVVATCCTMDNIELIARKDRGIKEPSDLKGRRIGVTRKSVAEFFLESFLIFNRLNPGDIEVADFAPADLVEALSEGSIDAGITWQPNVFKIKSRLGENAISWPAQSGRRYNMLVIANQPFINDNQKVIEQYLTSLIQAENVLASREGSEEFANYIARKYSYPSQYMENTWPKHRFVVTLPESLLLIMEEQARWVIENEQGDNYKIPNYFRRVYIDGLEKVRPTHVRIIR